MTLKAALVQSACPSTATTQDFTDAQFSSDVKAAIFWMTKATANNTTSSDFSINVGFTDFTTKAVVGLRGTDAANPTHWRRHHSSSNCIGLVQDSSTFAALGNAATLSNGARVTWSSVTGSQELVNCLLLGGSDVLAASVCSADFTNAGAGETVAVTHGLGATPDIIFGIAHMGTANTSGSSFGNISFGWWYNGTYGEMGQGRVGGQATEAGGGSLQNTGILIANNSDQNYTVTLGSVGGTTFNMISSAGATTDRMTFLCLKINNLVSKAGNTTTPTSTGNTATISGMSGKPSVVMWLPWFATLLETQTADSDAMFNLGVAVNNNGTTQELSTNACTDLGANSNKCRISNTLSFRVPNQVDSTQITATVNSWDSGGVTQNYSATLGAGRAFNYLAFGAPSNVVTITTISGDDIMTSTEANVAIVGTNFGATQGASTILLVDGVTTQALSVVDWAASLIHVNMSLGACRYGALKVRLTIGTTVVDHAVTVNPPTGTTAVNLSALKILSFDTRNCPNRIYDSPDVASNSQARYAITGGSGSPTLSADGSLSWPVADTQITWAWNSGDGTGWASDSVWDLKGPFPDLLSNIPTQSPVQSVAFSNDLSIYFQETDSVSAPMTFAKTAGSWPTGLSISSAGVLSGTPSVNGTFTGIVVTATNAESGTKDSNTFSVIVAASPNVTFSGPIPNATFNVGDFVNINLSTYFTNATGYSTGSTLPDGVTLAGGVISGLVTGVGVPAGGSTGYSITVTGSNAVPSSANSTAFTLTVNGATNQVVVPDLTSIPYTQTDAFAALTAVGLLGQATVAWTGATLLSQSIAPGTSVSPGTTVFLSPIGTSVPNFPGVYLINNGATTTPGGGQGWQGGEGIFVVAGTFNGATITLQMLAPDAATWIDVPSTALSSAGVAAFFLSPCQLRARVSNATPSGIYAAVNRVVR